MNYNSYIYFENNTVNIFYKEKIWSLELKESIKNSYIFLEDKFIYEFIKFIKKNLYYFFYNKSVAIIYKEIYSSKDLEYIKKIFYVIGYKCVDLINIKNFIKLTKKEAYLVENILYFVDKHNYKRKLVFDNSLLDEEIIILLKNRLKNKLLYVISNSQNYVNILEKNKVDYYLLGNMCYFLKFKLFTNP